MDNIQHGEFQNQRDDNFLWIRRYDVVAPFSFKTKKLQTLFDWWNSFHPRVPHKREFNISEHGEITSDLFLIKYLGNKCFEYRINGENVIELVGYSMVGIKFSINSPSPSQQLLAQYCQELINSDTCKRSIGEIRINLIEKIGFEALDCPLLDDQGNLSFILGAISIIS